MLLMLCRLWCVMCVCVGGGGGGFRCGKKDGEGELNKLSEAGRK